MKTFVQNVSVKTVCAMKKKIDTKRTARARAVESLPARHFYSAIEPASTWETSVLDWGCGRGADLEFYERMGLIALGYDPNFPSCDGYSARKYDYITCFYVLCVLPKNERAAVLKRAKKHLAKNGKIFIAVRSKSEINKYSSKWEKFEDGYITGANTFQHGFTNDELKTLVESVGLSYSKWNHGAYVGCIAKKQ